jgi:hypothetical protein
LDGQVIDYGLDAWNLCGVGGGEGARGFAADRAVEGGDLLLDRGLNGLVAEGGVAGDAALESGGQAGVICGGRGAFASGKAEGDGESCGGQDSA